MSQYRHGAYIQEEATRLVTPAKAECSLPVVVGCAPVHRLANAPAPVNDPRLVYSMPEFERLFGKPAKDDDQAQFELWQMANIYFTRYKVAPVVFINVFDPAVHCDTEMVENPEHTGEEDQEHPARIEKKTPNVSKVTKQDIIGGTDEQHRRTGLALVDEIFPRFRLTPGIIMSPRWSKDVTVAKAIETSCNSISGFFRASGIIEIPDTVKHHTEAPAYLNDNNLCDQDGNTICQYGDYLYNDVVEPGACHLAGCIGARDRKSDNVPYWSPSNNQIEAEGMTHHGEIIHLTPEEASYINGQGIVTGLNMIGGLKCWGDQTTAYPGNTDVKDSSIPIRRMFTYIGNTLIQTCWQFVSNPVRRRLIETVQDSINYYINGLVGQGYLLGGRCDFEQADNPTSDLLSGIVRWHVYLCPPQAGRELTFILEYDPDYLSTLFASGGNA